MSRVILGVDPGTSVLGYGVIRVQNKNIELITAGVIQLQKLEDHYEKLHKIYQRLSSIIKEFKPTECAVESPFFGKNVQSMLKLGRAQGISIVCAMNYGISVVEYSPKKIKQSVTGNGNASKEQVARMLASILKGDKIPDLLDATDALGAAVCHYMQNGSGAIDYKKKSGKKTSSWKSFLKQRGEI